MHTWQIQQAKTHFSELVRATEQTGPQAITWHGRSVAVVLSSADCERLTGTGQSLVDFMQRSPWPMPPTLTLPAMPASRARWMSQRPAATLHLSVLTLGELRTGIGALPDGDRKSRLLDWLEVELAGFCWSHTARRCRHGGPVGPLDGASWSPIASHCQPAGCHRADTWPDAGHAQRQRLSTPLADLGQPVGVSMNQRGWPCRAHGPVSAGMLTTARALWGGHASCCCSPGAVG